MRVVFNLREFVRGLRHILPRRGALTGGQAAPRVKSYSAESGYVYQYFYEGRRDTRAGPEFVFRFSADRKTWMTVSVVVAVSAIAAWQKAHGRELSANEQYAVAKMALFLAFDERSKPAELLGSVRVRNADLERIVERLGL